MVQDPEKRGRRMSCETGRSTNDTILVLTNSLDINTR